MANLLVKDANGDIVEIKATGAGTTGDPFIIERLTKLGAGTAGIGKLTANSGVDIGDVTLNGPLGRGADADSISVALSTENAALLDGLESVLGATTGAAVITDANGTVQQYLRGLVALWLAGALGVNTELPSAAALADAAANPTTPMVGADLLGFNGATWDRVRVQNVRKDLSAVTITTITTVWTPASGKKFRLMGGSISVSAACNVLFEDNSAGAGNFVWRTPKLAADTPYNFDLGNGKLSAVADQVLKATSSAAATITGTLYGVEE